MRNLALVILAVISSLVSSQAQQRDSLIVGSISIDTSSSVIWVPYYGVTFDTLGYYDVQVHLNAPTGGILLGNIINYNFPLNTWLHDDAINIETYNIRQVGWADSAALLYTAGQRVHLWSITFLIIRGTSPQTIGIDIAGSFSFGNNPVFVPGYVYYSPLDVNEQLQPERFALSQNYPNPFNSSTIMEFSLPKSEDVTLTIYDLLGHQIRILKNGRLDDGAYSIVWDGRDEVGRDTPSGSYFYRLFTDNAGETKRMTLIR
jgi:hypothetical protein